MNILPYFMPFSFALFWFLMLFAQARMSGWSELAKKYRNDNSIVDWTGWQYGTIGAVEYKGCLWLAATAEGLYIKTGPLFLFRPFHPTILIPWAEITKVQERKRMFLFPKVVDIQMQNSHVKLAVSKKAFVESRRFLGDKLLLEEKKPQN
jgi:hypothetical protein